MNAAHFSDASAGRWRNVEPSLAFAGVQSLSKVEWEDKLAYLQVTREEDYSKQSNLSNFFPKFKKED